MINRFIIAHILVSWSEVLAYASPLFRISFNSGLKKDVHGMVAYMTQWLELSKIVKKELNEIKLMEFYTKIN